MTTHAQHIPGPCPNSTHCGNCKWLRENRSLIAAAPELADFVSLYVSYLHDADHQADHDGPDEPLCTLDNPLCLDMEARALLATIEGTGGALRANA